MAESSNHILLVNHLKSWVIEKFLDGDEGKIFVDHPDSNSCQRPPIMNGFIPDIYVPSGPYGLMIIGEAKTARDLERKHSQNQFEQFLNKCAEVNNSLFIIAVPWYSVRLAESILKYLKNKSNAGMVTTEVLEKLGD